MSLSPGRVRLALLSLALGGFGIGLAEFVAMGLLPNLAADLLPGLWADSHERANAQAGWLVSAYALGVVVGAPTIAAVVARFPRKQLLLACVAMFTVGTVASAVLPSFGLVLLARFVAALPHGAYFGIAALVAASLMGPGKRGQGVALVLSGLTIANVVGVPAITFLGQQAGWRVAYLVVALVFALVLVVAGLGMTIGNFIGGRAADRSVMGTLFSCFGAFAVALAGFALTAHTPVGLFVFVFLVAGAGAALSPAIQTRLMDVAGESQTLAAAINHSSLNIGNSIGAYLGGVTIAAGFGYLSPAWAGLLLCIPGVGLGLVSVLLQRRARRGSEAAGEVGFDQDPVFDRTLA